ncbi:MFS transporter [Streptomyces sp. NBC_00667]|uniref:MFS transporter n=1 Tax=Streptomyces sp. NBC_00667 TaxID=2975803 RepID=UPI002E3677E8|nr:MFS transporter [Streptomyces sp. NBC_00667]WUC68504.1 MFS transporter [Streptomyces sp. NBC_00539]
MKGWTSTSVLTAFATAAALLSAFTAHQSRRAERAMLPRSLLRRPGVLRGSTSLALLSFALYGALFVNTLYLQGVLRFTPLEAGVRTLPMAAALAVGSAAALPLLARHGCRPPIVAGLALVTAAFAVLADTRATSGYGHLAIFQLIGGLGAGLVAACGTEAVMGAVPPAQAGLGSAVNDATRQIGAALGVAVQGSVLTTVITNHLGTPPPGVTPTTALPSTNLAARHAFIDGLTATALTAGAVTLTAAALAAVSYSRILSLRTTPGRRARSKNSPLRWDS